MISIADEETIKIKELVDLLDEASRIIHTCTGNYNNMGLDAYGGILEKIQDQLMIGTEDRETIVDYSNHLSSLAEQLNQTATEAESNRSISAKSCARLNLIYLDFVVAQQSLVKHLIPFDRDELAREEDDDEISDIDFAIQKDNDG